MYLHCHRVWFYVNPTHGYEIYFPTLLCMQFFLLHAQFVVFEGSRCPLCVPQTGIVITESDHG